MRNEDLVDRAMDTAFESRRAETKLLHKKPPERLRDTFILSKAMSLHDSLLPAVCPRIDVLTSTTLLLGYDGELEVNLSKSKDAWVNKIDISTEF